MRLQYKGTHVYLEWIPSHCGINGNEMADRLAKQALYKEIEINNKLCISEVKTMLRLELYSSWEQKWKKNAEETNRQFKPIILHNFECSLNRNSEVILRRLRLCNIGLNADPAKVYVSEPIIKTTNCDQCNRPTPETIIHFLIECPKYTIQRAMLMAETNISHPNEILNLLKSGEQNIQRAIVSFVHRMRTFDDH